MANIGVIGWYGKHNIGDESYKLSFPRLFPQHNFIFGNTPVGMIADSFILGGGDIASPEFLTPLTAINNKHLMSVTVSKPTDLVKNFKSIAVRDMRSVANCATSGVQATYVPDFAFALDYDRRRGQSLIEKYFANRELYTKVIVVVVNSHLVPEGWGLARELGRFQQLAFEMTTVMDFTSASFLFVPFGQEMPWDDRISSSWISHRCKWWKKNAVINDQIKVQDTLDIISAADAVISTRLHSTIFSTITGTPFVDITHNHKNQGFLETNGLMKHSLSYVGIEATGLGNRLQAIVDNSIIRNELNKVTINNKKILSTFAKKADLLG